MLLASHGCGATTLEGLSVLEEGSCSALRLKYGARDRLEATVQSYEEQVGCTCLVLFLQQRRYRPLHLAGAAVVAASRPPFSHSACQAIVAS